MLTRKEQQVCRTARFTQGRDAIGYGTLEDGLCPLGTVIVLRGAPPHFRLRGGKHWCTFFTPYGLRNDGTEDWRLEEQNREIVDAVTADVLEWAGYPSVSTFLDALEEHGTAIFPVPEESMAP